MLPQALQDILSIEQRNWRLFKEGMTEVVYAAMNPLACVPFTNIWETTKAVVLPFVPKFSGLGAAKLHSDAGTISCKPDSAIIVPILEEHGHQFSDTYSKVRCHYQKQNQNWKGERYGTV